VLVLVMMLVPTASRKKPPPMKVYMVKIKSEPEPRKEEVVAKGKEEVVKKKPEVKPKKQVEVKKKPKKVVKKKEKKAKPKSKPATPTSVRLDNPAFDSPFYINLVLTKVNNNWLDPLPTTKAHLTVTVYFRILRSGKINDLKVENSSGSPVFDQAAVQAINLSEPFPPLPDDYKSDFLGVHFEFEHIW